MDKFLVQYKRSYILVPIAIVFGLILKFIDATFSQKKIDRKEYIKFSLLIGFISTVIVYIHTIKGKIEEEVVSGPPPF